MHLEEQSGRTNHHFPSFSSKQDKAVGSVAPNHFINIRSAVKDILESANYQTSDQCAVGWRLQLLQVPDLSSRDVLQSPWKIHFLHNSPRYLLMAVILNSGSPSFPQAGASFFLLSSKQSQELEGLSFPPFFSKPGALISKTYMDPAGIYVRSSKPSMFSL